MSDKMEHGKVYNIHYGIEQAQNSIDRAISELSTVQFRYTDWE